MRKVQEHPTLMFYLCMYLGGKRGVFCGPRVHECITVVDSGQRETAFQHRGSCGGSGEWRVESGEWRVEGEEDNNSQDEDVIEACYASTFAAQSVHSCKPLCTSVTLPPPYSRQTPALAGGDIAGERDGPWSVAITRLARQVP